MCCVLRLFRVGIFVMRFPLGQCGKIRNQVIRLAMLISVVKLRLERKEFPLLMFRFECVKTFNTKVLLSYLN